MELRTVRGLVSGIALDNISSLGPKGESVGILTRLPPYVTYQFPVGCSLVIHNTVNLVFHDNRGEPGFKFLHGEDGIQVQETSLCVTVNWVTCTSQDKVTTPPTVFIMTSYVTADLFAPPACCSWRAEGTKNLQYSQSASCHGASLQQLIQLHVGRTLLLFGVL